MKKRISHFLARHPAVTQFLGKVVKDNIGMLASVVAWTVLTSIVPIIFGLLAVSGFLLRNASLQLTVTSHVHQALLGVLSIADINALVHTAIQNRGIFSVLGLVGILWGGSNVGTAFATVFQPIFQVRGRDLWKEKLLDLGMIFVFIALMIVIILGTTAGALLDRLVSGFPLTGIFAFVIGTAISLVAAFLLFVIIYTVFPNVEPRFKMGNIWEGAAIAAVLFEILTFIFPIYSHFSHFQRYGAILFPIVLLTTWIWFFALVMIVGSEFVAFKALNEARAQGRPIGPAPDGTVPQRMDPPFDPGLRRTGS